MLKSRTDSSSSIIPSSSSSSNSGNSNNLKCNCNITTTPPGHDEHPDHLDNPNSAKATAISCHSEHDLRVPFYCEENVWRLAYRRIFGRSTAKTATTTITDTILENAHGKSADVDKENELYYAVFISNDDRCCPMLNQKASKNTNEPCFWDYHVILIQTTKGARNKKGGRGTIMSNHHQNNGDRIVTKKTTTTTTTRVFDMDSTLSYPCTLDEYLNGTFFYLDFMNGKAEKKRFSPKFRVIRAELYLQHFYSDRMHMYKDGVWSATPPSYDCILTTAADVMKNNMKMKKQNGASILSNLNDYISMAGGKGKETSLMGEVLTLHELRSKFEA